MFMLILDIGAVCWAVILIILRFFRIDHAKKHGATNTFAFWIVALSPLVIIGLIHWAIMKDSNSGPVPTMTEALQP